MKYAVLGDIHGNWEALRVVLADAERQGVGAYVSVGDVVGYYPDPGRCIDAVRDLNCACVRGNHDAFTVEPFTRNDLTQYAAAGVLWTREHLDEARSEFLRGLPTFEIVDDFTVVHNTLNPAEKWQYVVDIADATRHFLCQTTPICFHGHTHVPVVFEGRDRVRVRLFHAAGERPIIDAASSHRVDLDDGVRYFINVGSVGQPRDRDPRAAYALYDTDRREVVLRRLPYDIEAARARVKDASLPQWLGLRLGVGL